MDWWIDTWTDGLGSVSQRSPFVTDSFTCGSCQGGGRRGGALGDERTSGIFFSHTHRRTKAFVGLVTIAGDVCRCLAALALAGGVEMTPDWEEILEEKGKPDWPPISAFTGLFCV